MTRLQRVFALGALSISTAVAQDVVYVTDLSIFTVLAPCAASAVSYAVQSQTYDNCPEAVGALQSCVCTKNENFASISKAISSSVSYSCGGTASEDQSSAATVLDAYCNQDQEFSFPGPQTPVSEYITDIAAFDELAPCAKSGLSYILQSMTYDLCPPEASNLATCVCNKNQNSLRVSQGINTSVRYSCASNTADIASAQAIFSGYCGLNNGTSSFPKASPPPGDMSYYITALSQFSSLAPCARSAVSYDVFSQTNDYCPGGPQALASCVCLKDGMSRLLTNMITSSVKYSCESTATEDISSALEVFDYYCSAAQALVTPAGITETASETAMTGDTAASGPTQTSDPTSDSGDFGLGGSGSGSSGSGNSSSDSGDSSDGGGSNGGSSSQSGSSTNNTGVIVGAVVGVVGGLALIAAAAFFFIWRRRRAQKARAQVVGAANGESDVGTTGKPELDSAVAALVGSPSSPSPSASKAEPPPPPRTTDNVSPVSAHNAASELHSQPPAPQMSELHAPQGQSQGQGQGQAALSPQQAASPYSPSSPAGAQEAFGQQVYEAPVQHPTQVHEMQAQPGAENWQSGPVPLQYHEMDGSSRR